MPRLQAFADDCRTMCLCRRVITVDIIFLQKKMTDKNNLQRAGVTIRKSTDADIDVIMDIYDSARRYMRAAGNTVQWTDGYPSRGVVSKDIASGNSYVGTDGSGEIVMVFSFILGDEPTYKRIYDGAWPDDCPYGTVHRLASTGKVGGMLRLCIDFCFTLTGRVRLDTHADNAPMLAAVGRLGFTRCGVIYVEDGTPRIAFAKEK